MTTELASDVDVANIHAAEVKRAERKERWLRRLPLLPALVFTVVVTQVPFLIALWISLNDWAFLTPNPIEFIGLIFCTCDTHEIKIVTQWLQGVFTMFDKIIKWPRPSSTQL